MAIASWVKGMTTGTWIGVASALKLAVLVAMDGWGYLAEIDQRGFVMAGEARHPAPVGAAQSEEATKSSRRCPGKRRPIPRTPRCRA